MKPAIGQTAVFIGSGNVATNLSVALSNAGVTIGSVWSPHKNHREILSARVKAHAANTLGKIDKTADFYIISVSDDKITEVVETMPEVSGIVAHTSGVTALQVISKRFENSGVFYPLQTFSIEKHTSMQEVPFCIEGNTHSSLQALTDLAKTISSGVFNINSGERKKLHLAAVFVSNFVNHLYLSAEELLKEDNLPFELLKPLIKEVAGKVMNLPPVEAQTGPARRNDQNTIAKHRELLQDYPDYLEMYNLFTQQIIKKYHE